MAVSKYRYSMKKKFNSDMAVIINNLGKENTYLKKTLAELSRQHSDHNKLVEKFLALETRRFDSFPHSSIRDEKAGSSSDEMWREEGTSINGETPRRKLGAYVYTKEIEEIKNNLATISNKCEYLEEIVAEKQEISSKQTSFRDEVVLELQSQLQDAMEKNRRWLEYDQQREAYVRAAVGRISELEKQLKEANQTHSQEHKENHSDDVRLSQMQVLYKKLLQKAKDENEVLLEQAEATHRRLAAAQDRCMEKEKEVEELRQLLENERLSKESEEEEHDSPDDEEEEPTRDETEELKDKLKEERRRSTGFEIQSNLFQRFMLNHHHADQEKIDELHREIKISSQDLEDEKQNCSYLKKQLLKILRVPSKAKMLKRNKRDREERQLSPQSSSRPSSTQSSVLNESSLECPSCQAEFPASQYRDLLHHLETCME